MSKRARIIAEVPAAQRADGVRWLVIAFDPDSGGWFLFGHLQLEEASAFDSWHVTQAEALSEAEFHWGTLPEDWHAEDSRA